MNSLLPATQRSAGGPPAACSAAPSLPPANEFFADIAGARMRYLRCGSGPPLLLVHGLLGYSFCWRRNFAALSRHFDVIAPDLLGIGFSDRPPHLDCSMRGAAQRMLQLLDHLGIEHTDVVGNSHGGGIAAMMAVLGIEAGHQRVRRLLLAAPVNPWSPYGRWITGALGSRFGDFAFPVVWSVLSRHHRFALRRMYGDPARIPPGTLEGYDAGVLQPGTREYLQGIMRCWRSDLRELETAYRRLQGIPLRLLWGDRDRAVLPHSAARLRQAAPPAELIVLPGVGHLPQEEAPEDFNRIATQFFRQER